jgi:hypothetical protein
MIGSVSRSLDIAVHIIVTCQPLQRWRNFKAILPMVPVHIAGVRKAGGHKSAATHDAATAAFFSGNPDPRQLTPSFFCRLDDDVVY